MPEILTGFSPPLTPDNFTPIARDSFSDKDGLDTADNTDKYLRLRSNYHLGVPMLQQPAALDSEKYSRDVVRISDFFNRSLGIRSEIRNYYPPLARAMWEQMLTTKEKQQFLEHEITQVIKALGERYNAVESVARYTIDESFKLRSEAFPNEIFEEVVKRGIEYRKKLGSPDSHREEQELKGILKVEQKMADPDTPDGFEMMVISGPGLVEGTSFIHNFVDRYQLKEDPVTKKRSVEMTRFNSNATYEQYQKDVSKSNPDYFKEMTEPIDVHLLSNPVEKFLNFPTTGLSKEDLQKIAEDSKLRISYYLEAVSAALFDPKEVALRFNAVLKGAEITWEKIKGIKDKVVGVVSSFFKQMPVFKSIVDEVNWLGKQVIERVMAACGLSGGFSLGEIGTGIGNVFSTVAIVVGTALGILESDSKGSLYFPCPNCGTINKRPKEGYVELCKNLNCTDRTKVRC